MFDDVQLKALCRECRSGWEVAVVCGSCFGTLGTMCDTCGAPFPDGDCSCQEQFWPLNCDFCGYPVFPGWCPHVTIEDFLFYGTIPAGVRAELEKEKQEKDGQC